MQRLAILNVVGLASGLIGPATPRLAEFAKRQGIRPIAPVFPALTCPAQATYLTGLDPARHGIVGNGWYDRELAEVHFWKQSNHLVHGKKIWELLREKDRAFTCAKLFWWYNMYSSADYSITPRPIYPADGRKVFDIYTWPYGIRTDIKKDLGEFPFPTFWGPAAGVDSPQGRPDAATRWIAASAKWIEERYEPSLSLVYLPHLDYCLQRLGPGDPGLAENLGRIDEIAGDLISFFENRSVRVAVVSEYGITAVNQPIHLNRLFREKGWISVKDELGREVLDCGASKAFAVADHQVAHIYLNDRSLKNSVRALLEQSPGIERILDPEEASGAALNHPRAGDLVAAAQASAWFTYYFWMDDSKAPDYARTVDIHRKPGYDPAELFVDPSLNFPRLKILSRLLQKKLGFRMLLDVIPLEAALVKGSHGRASSDRGEMPVLLGAGSDGRDQVLPPEEIFKVIAELALEGAMARKR